MQTSKKFVKEAGLHPKLRLMEKDVNEAGNEITVSTGKHTVQLVKDGERAGKDPKTQRPITVVRYLVKENGVLKTYDTPKLNKDTGELSYLVQRLAEFDEGATVVMEAKKMGTKNYIGVKLATGVVEPANTLHDEDEDDELDEIEGGMEEAEKLI